MSHEPRYDEMFRFVLEGSPCLVDNNYDKSKAIDIWIMREYGAPDSWVKQFIIKLITLYKVFLFVREIFWTPYNGRFGRNELGISNGSMKPMAIRRNGEILWKENCGLFVSVEHVVDNFKENDIGNGHGRPPLIHWKVKDSMSLWHI
ncbi:hypothetical protein BC332_19404 [Capsicum chinense]|nr:hypothetical protein BC332_19404 [Capsicum chinense]